MNSNLNAAGLALSDGYEAICQRVIAEQTEWERRHGYPDLCEELAEARKVPAAKVGEDLRILRRRLNEAKSCLTPHAKTFFRHCRFDRNLRSLIGDGHILVWVNDGRTTCGGVFCVAVD